MDCVKLPQFFVFFRLVLTVINGLLDKVFSTHIHWLSLSLHISLNVQKSMIPSSITWTFFYKMNCIFYLKLVFYFLIYVKLSRLSFPSTVQWMSLEFDSQCGTAQPEDILQVK